MQFISPSKGKLNIGQLFDDIVAYIEELPKNDYKLIIGTDSQAHGDACCFVTAVIVHRVGKGARYYYRKTQLKNINSLRQKIFYETSMSLAAASKIASRFAKNGHAKLNLEIHLDVGTKGDTKDLIRDVVGMVIGSGFKAKIKPESYGASTVADKYTK